jgi:hypothetical protein
MSKIPDNLVNHIKEEAEKVGDYGEIVIKIHNGNHDVWSTKKQKFSKDMNSQDNSRKG